LIAASESEEWPDGTITAGYRFVHALHQQVVRARVGTARQVRLHRLISERLETAYGERAAEIASHLAVHFEQGRDQRAVHYRRLAAEQALPQNAYREVQLHSKAGLALLHTLPDTLKRKQLELGLRQLVSTALYTTRGFMDVELEANLQRAWQLCLELEDDTTLVSILVGLGRLQMVRANHAAIAELEQEEERVAERIADAQLLVQLHTQLATIVTFRGLHERAADHYQQVLAHYDPNHRFLLPSFGGDPFVVASTWSGMSLTLTGRPDQGWSRIARALAHAEELNQPLALVNGLSCATLVKLLHGDYDEARQLAQKVDALTREYHLSLYEIAGGLLQSCIAVQRGALEEGIAGITVGISQYRALGAQHLVPFFLSFLAEGYRQQGKFDEALQTVSEAHSLTATNFDVFWEAELYRLKGEILLSRSGVQASRKSRVESKKSKIPPL
jgi:predicted ATPase